MMMHMMIIIKKPLLCSFASSVYISYLRLMLLNPTTDTCKQTALALGEMFVFVFGYLCMHSKQPRLVFTITLVLNPERGLERGFGVATALGTEGSISNAKMWDFGKKKNLITIHKVN